MPLSEEERRRRLESSRTQFVRDDPDLAWELESGRFRHVGRLGSLPVLAVFAGLALMFAGIAAQLLIVGAAGFVLACAGCRRLPDYPDTVPGLPPGFPPANE